MHFHLTRREVLDEVVSRYQFKLDDAQRIFEYLENSGKVTFAGAMFVINEPYAQDCVPVIELARTARGQAAGGAVSSYKTKELLDVLLRNSGQYTQKRSLTQS